MGLRESEREFVRGLERDDLLAMLDRVIAEGSEDDLLRWGSWLLAMRAATPVRAAATHDDPLASPAGVLASPDPGGAVERHPPGSEPDHRQVRGWNCGELKKPARRPAFETNSRSPT